MTKIALLISTILSLAAHGEATHDADENVDLKPSLELRSTVTSSEIKNIFEDLQKNFRMCDAVLHCYFRATLAAKYLEDKKLLNSHLVKIDCPDGEIQVVDPYTKKFYRYIDHWINVLWLNEAGTKVPYVFDAQFLTRPLPLSEYLKVAVPFSSVIKKDVRPVTNPWDPLKAFQSRDSASGAPCTYEFYDRRWSAAQEEEILRQNEAVAQKLHFLDANKVLKTHIDRELENKRKKFIPLLEPRDARIRWNTETLQRSAEQIVQAERENCFEMGAAKDSSPASEDLRQRILKTHRISYLNVQKKDSLFEIPRLDKEINWISNHPNSLRALDWDAGWKPEAPQLALRLAYLEAKTRSPQVSTEIENDLTERLAAESMRYSSEVFGVSSSMADAEKRSQTIFLTKSLQIVRKTTQSLSPIEIEMETQKVRSEANERRALRLQKMKAQLEALNTGVQEMTRQIQELEQAVK